MGCEKWWTFLIARSNRKTERGYTQFDCINIWSYGYILKRCELWRQELDYIECISINVWLRFNCHDPPQIELHVYSDALDSAYGVVAYFKLIFNKLTDIYVE